MKYLGPTRYSRLNEAVAVVFLLTGLFLILSFASYQPFDRSWNTATGSVKAANVTGPVGAVLSDFFLQMMGLGAYALPLLLFLLGWQWVRSEPVSVPLVRIAGSATLAVSTCTLLGMTASWYPIASAIPAGGLLGAVVAEYLISGMNLPGALLFTGGCWILSIYLVPNFEIARMGHLLRPPFSAPAPS